MKTPVLDLKDYIGWLKSNRETIAKEMPMVLTPEEIKSKTLEAVVGKPGDGLLAFKEVLDSIKKEAYIKGQLQVIDHLIMVAEKHILNYEQEYKNP